MYQVQDHYFKKAKKENYLARSVYKLQEIDEKYRLIKPGDKILDLGCAPGSWLQYCAQKVGEKGLVVGVDIKPLPAMIAPNVRFLQGDLLKMRPAEIAKICPVYDLVLCDMAPATSGIKWLDQERSQQLVNISWNFAKHSLKPGGGFLTKLFQGENTKNFLDELRKSFAQVKTVKPQTSQRSKLEIYLLADGWKS
ncbi:MAG: RlmE family RNA methyltransferase [Candidatus Schekmanbacteria bacterium]|nr:RlmE family RNA methyltransferase [Candidatus Schekmanbacteria bacterium]